MRELVFHLLVSVAGVVATVALSRADRRGTLVCGCAVSAVVLPLVFSGIVFPGGAPAFATMRLLAGLIFVETPIVLVIAVVLSPRAWTTRRLLGGVAAIALVGIAIDAFLIEPHALTIRRETIRSARIHERLRVVVLSDLQTDAPGDFERRVIDTANGLRPDLVLLPGDYVQLPRGEAYRVATRRLGTTLDSLRPRLGTFAVRGNVEHRGFVRDVFGGTRIRAFDETTAIAVGPIDLVALSFSDSFDPGFARGRGERFQLIFGHGPDFMLGPAQGDLLVAGHTHGGQVQLPFVGPLITFSSVPNAWAAGGHRVRDDGVHLDVSRGIGMERDAAPRFRFLCRPEIVVIDLVPAGP